MIRTGLAAARQLLKTPAVQLAIAGMALQYGINAIVSIVTELRDEVTELSHELASARASADVSASMVAAKTPGYPGPQDVDPLDRGEPDLEGDPAPRRASMMSAPATEPA